MVRERVGETAARMSALPPIADIGEGIAECPLLTHSGHWTTLGGFEGGVLTVQPDEHVGGAEDVDVGGHEPLERPSKG